MEGKITRELLDKILIALQASLNFQDMIRGMELSLSPNHARKLVREHIDNAMKALQRAEII